MIRMNTALHNHLDRQVRPKGECYGCDLFWEHQKEVLAAKVRHRAAALGITLQDAAKVPT